MLQKGGVYGREPEETKCCPGSGGCLTAAEIQHAFGTFDVSMLPAKGPWYTAGRKETDSEASARAGQVAKWLRSGAFDKAVGPEAALVLLVTHGQFMSKLTSAVLGISGGIEHDVSEAGFSGSSPVRFHTPNTATSLFFLKPSGRVSVRWVSGTPHLGRSAKRELQGLL